MRSPLPASLVGVVGVAVVAAEQPKMKSDAAKISMSKLTIFKIIFFMVIFKSPK